MLFPDGLVQTFVRGVRMARLHPWRALRCAQRYPAGLALLLALAMVTASQGAGDEVRLTRKYRSGRAMVYITKVHTNSIIHSHPPNLKDFFPPMPTDLRLSQQCTVTVSKVHADGAADIQQRFDKFEVQADLGTLPQNIRESVAQAQEEVSQQMVGKMLTAHYDRKGRLVDFEGADDLFQGIDAPVREPLLQMLRLFLEQMGGQSLYPDHRLKVGEEWSQDLDAQPLKNYPFQVQGKGTMRYSGKTRYQGVRAAIVDYHFQNALTPALEGLRQGGALPQLEAMGMHLEMKISGKGQGRILVALDDGRVLQNHSTLSQTLRALMQGKEGLMAPSELAPRLEIVAVTEMDVDGSKPQ
jgi:hypothetical protein